MLFINHIYSQAVTGPTTEFTPSDDLSSETEELTVVLVGKSGLPVDITVNNQDSYKPTTEVESLFLFPKTTESEVVQLEKPENTVKLVGVQNVQSVTVVDEPGAVVGVKLFLL